MGQDQTVRRGVDDYSYQTQPQPRDTQLASVRRVEIPGLYSIIIPTRDEPLIQTLVDEVHAALADFDHEVLVIDKSKEAPRVENATVIVQRSKGLGNAILEALEYVRGEWVAIIDGDGSHRPEDLANMIRETAGGKYDLVLGSRYAKGGENKDVFTRRMISGIFNRFTRLVLGLKYKDPMSGLIVAKTEVFRRVNPSPIGFKINLEMIYRAEKLGFRGSEAPIRFVPRTAGSSKAGIGEAFRTLSYIIRLRFGRRRNN